MAIYAVDFDGVLHDPSRVEAGRKMGPPMFHAYEALTALYRAGHTIIVHTHRAVRDVRHVVSWLEYFHMPFHDVTAQKPNADYFIDDHGVHFVSWDKLIPNLSAITNRHEVQDASRRQDKGEGHASQEPQEAVPSRSWKIVEDDN